MIEIIDKKLNCDVTSNVTAFLNAPQNIMLSLAINSLVSRCLMECLLLLDLPDNNVTFKVSNGTKQLLSIVHWRQQLICLLKKEATCLAFSENA